MTNNRSNPEPNALDIPPASPKIIAIGGGKGGIGKTIVSASLSIALAEANKKVVVIDADLGGANLHTAFGVYMPTRTLYDFYTRKVSSLADVLLETPIPGVQVICGAPGSPGMANIKYWEKLKTIRHFNRFNADFIIVDLGAGMSFNEIDFFNSAQMGIVVANPEPTSIHECYNFIKVALFRKLRRAFLDYPEVLEILDRTSEPSHLNDRRLISQIAEEVRNRNLRAGVRFYKLLNNTSPKLILNRVHNYNEYMDGLSLQVAVQDLLRIKLDYWGYIPYSKHVPQAIRAMRPTELLRPNSDFRAKVVKMVQKYLLHKDVNYTSPGARTIVPITDVFPTDRAHPRVLKKQATRICSIHCELWGKCHYQEGGLPCRMPEREYQERMSRLKFGLNVVDEK
ncbi:MAG: MinD/ParA family protein [Calditrichaeota bacterium]|nr:MAG: MinD/ParA family protein [Calditrichota bacterium]